jgi:hypothetical protein
MTRERNGGWAVAGVCAGSSRRRGTRTPCGGSRPAGPPEGSRTGPSRVHGREAQPGLLGPCAAKGGGLEEQSRRQRRPVGADRVGHGLRPTADLWSEGRLERGRQGGEGGNRAVVGCADAQFGHPGGPVRLVRQLGYHHLRCTGPGGGGRGAFATVVYDGRDPGNSFWWLTSRRPLGPPPRRRARPCCRTPRTRAAWRRPGTPPRRRAAGVRREALTRRSVGHPGPASPATGPAPGPSPATAGHRRRSRGRCPPGAVVQPARTAATGGVFPT